MSDLFNPGVSKKSEQLRRILLPLDKLVTDMEKKRDLVSFAKKHPQDLRKSIADLRKARKLIYRVIERLNFPG